ncbi:MAG: TetR/AcrR family transcriptional regulator [Flavobacteriales bacterium]
MKKTISRKEKVLKTALQMVASGGFQGAPIAELASKSKVAVGTIYHHFANKDEMVKAMYLYCKEEMAAAIAPAFEGKNNTAKKFDLMWSAVMNHATSNAVQISFMDQFSSSPLINASVSKDASKFDAASVKFFADGIKSKDLKKSEPELLHEFFMTNAIAAARKASKGKKKGADKEVAALKEMTWSGLKK